MATLELVLLAALTLLIALAIGIVVFVSLRSWRLGVRHKRLLASSTRIRRILEEHYQDDFRRMDRLLFELRDVPDPELLDSALRRLGGDGFEEITDEARPGLARLYESFGLLDLHLERLQSSRHWRERADSALLLARLGDIRAIPVLAATLRNRYEDENTVKAAAARALGLFRAEGTAAALLEELRDLNEWSSPRIAEILVELGQRAVEPSMAVLEDDSVNLRAWSAQVLGHLGDTRAVQPLIRRLDDRSSQVRMAAAEALGRLGDRRAVSTLTRKVMRDPIAQVRAESARALGRIGDGDSLDALVVGLGDSDYWTRLRALEALERLNPESPDLLLEAARSTNKELARGAAHALERTGFVQRWIDGLALGRGLKLQQMLSRLELVGRSGARDALSRMVVEHTDFRVRCRIAELLGRVAAQDVQPALIRAMADPEWPVRAKAAEAYAALAPEDVSPIVRLLEDPEETVRNMAIDALRSLGPLEDVPEELGDLLARLALNANSEMREAVLDLLARVTTEGGFQAARALLGDPVDSIRARALELVGAHAGEASVPALVEYLSDPSEAVRSRAAGLLGNIGTTDAVRGLVKSTFESDEGTREAVTNALAGLGFDKLFEAIDLFMASPTEDARLAVLWTLGKAADERGLPMLSAALKDDRPKVRASAAGALGNYRTEVAGDALAGAVNDRDARTRAAAVNSLGRMGMPEYVPAVLPMLEDPDPFVRRRALVAIGAMGSDATVPTLAPYLDRPEAPHAAIALALIGSPQAVEAVADWLVGPGRHRLLGDAIEGEREDISGPIRALLGLYPSSASEEDIDSWAESLQRTLANSQDPDERLRALELLRSWRGGVPTKWLEDTVSTDPDERVRQRAVALVAREGEAAGGVLSRALRDPSASVRIEALRWAALAPDLGPAVLPCAGTGGAEMDALTRAALAGIYEKSPLDLVDLLMGTERLPCRRVAVGALGDIASPRTVGLLGRLLRDEAEELRGDAAAALGSIRTQEAEDELLAGLADPAETVRLAAMRGLFECGSSGALRAAQVAGEDPSAQVREVLATLLLEDMTPAAGRVLEDLAHDPLPAVRRAAMCSLLGRGALGDLDIFNRVMATWEPVEVAVLQRTAIDLELGSIVARMLAGSSSVSARLAAIETLRFLGPTRHAEELLAALEDPVPEVRLAVIQSLSGVPDAEVRRRLTRAANDMDPQVRAAARTGAGVKVL